MLDRLNLMKESSLLCTAILNVSIFLHHTLYHFHLVFHFPPSKPKDSSVHKLPNILNIVQSFLIIFLLNIKCIVTVSGYFSAVYALNRDLPESMSDSEQEQIKSELLKFAEKLVHLGVSCFFSNLNICYYFMTSV